MDTYNINKHMILEEIISKWYTPLFIFTFAAKIVIR